MLLAFAEEAANPIVDEPGQEGQYGGEADFKVIQAKKLRHAVQFMADTTTPLTLLSAAVATTPSIHMSNRLQHFGHTAGGGIGELVCVLAVAQSCRGHGSRISEFWVWHRWGRIFLRGRSFAILHRLENRINLR